MAHHDAQVSLAGEIALGHQHFRCQTLWMKVKCFNLDAASTSIARRVGADEVIVCRHAPTTLEDEMCVATYQEPLEEGSA